jgi:RNA recognition motif-containing protein
MAIRLFVGNLPYNTTEAELREHFSAIGPLVHVYLPTDRETGKQRGFAFLEFNDRAQAEEAVRRFNNQLFKGRPITINEARAREERPRTGAPMRTSSAPRREFTPNQAAASPPPPGEAAGRNFGPDAPPRRSRGKTRSGPKSERVPKGPMREVIRGQFFGGDDDESYDDDMSGDNFASRVNDFDNEDD